MKTHFLALVLVCAAASFAFGADPESIGYASLPSLIAGGGIEKAEIYDFGANNIDAVFTRKDGTVFAVDRPPGLDEDAVLLQSLKDHAIPFLVYDRGYDGASKRNPFGKHSLFMLLPGLLLFGVPLLLLLVIWRQAKTISKQSDTIRELARNGPRQS